MSQVETLADVFVRNPLLRRQVGAMRRTSWQRAAHIGTWALFGVALLVAVGQSALDLTGRWGLSARALALVAFLTACRSLIAGAGIVSHERERQTWDMLVLTRLTPLQLLAGKMVPAVLTVVGPAVAAVPLVALLGWAGGVSVAPTLLALLCVISLAPPWTALAMRLSANAERTTDAFVRALAVMALTSPLVLETLALLQGARYGEWSFAAVIHLAATTLCLSAAVTAALLLSTAGVMAGSARGYLRQARFATGAAYVLALVLVYLVMVAARPDWGYWFEPGLFATMAGLNALVPSVGVALACAAAGVPEERKRFSLRSFHPFAAGPEGALGLWALLYLAGSSISTLPWLLADRTPLRHYGMVRPSVWLALLGPACLLAGGSFGCWLAHSFPRWPAVARMALAAALPLALLVLPQCLVEPQDYYATWSPFAGRWWLPFSVAAMQSGPGPHIAGPRPPAMLAYAAEAPRQALIMALNGAYSTGRPLLPMATLYVAVVVGAGSLRGLARRR